MAISTFENPIITCTEHQLAWAAWQTAQGVPPEFQQDDSTGENRQLFDLYWRGVLTGQLVLLSPVLLCLDAWVHGLAASAPKVPGATFLQWWMTIVATGATFDTK